MAVFVSASTTSQTVLLWERVVQDQSKRTAERFTPVVADVLQNLGYAVVASFPAVAGVHLKRLKKKSDPGKFYVFPAIESDEALQHATVSSFERIWLSQLNHANADDSLGLEKEDICAIRSATGADTIVFVTVEGTDSTAADTVCNWSCCIALVPITLIIRGSPPVPTPDGWSANFYFIDANNGQCLWQTWHHDGSDPETPSSKAIAGALRFFPANGQPMDTSRCTRHGEMAHCKEME